MEKGLRLTMYGHADLWLLLCPELAAGPEKLNPMVACCLSDGGHKGLRCLFVARWVVINSSVQVYRRGAASEGSRLSCERWSLDL